MRATGPLAMHVYIHSFYLEIVPAVSAAAATAATVVSLNMASLQTHGSPLYSFLIRKIISADRRFFLNRKQFSAKEWKRRKNAHAAAAARQDQNINFCLPVCARVCALLTLSIAFRLFKNEQKKEREKTHACGRRPKKKNKMTHDIDVLKYFMALDLDAVKSSEKRENRQMWTPMSVCRENFICLLSCLADVCCILFFSAIAAVCINSRIQFCSPLYVEAFKF